VEEIGAVAVAGELGENGRAASLGGGLGFETRKAAASPIIRPERLRSNGRHFSVVVAWRQSKPTKTSSQIASNPPARTQSLSPVRIMSAAWPMAFAPLAQALAMMTDGLLWRNPAGDRAPVAGQVAFDLAEEMGAFARDHVAAKFFAEGHAAGRGGDGKARSWRCSGRRAGAGRRGRAPRARRVARDGGARQAAQRLARKAGQLGQPRGAGAMGAAAGGVEELERGVGRTASDERVPRRGKNSRPAA